MKLLVALMAVSVQLILGALPASSEGQFLSGDRRGRAYRLYVPSRPVAGPLVVALHGCWQTPEDFALGTRLNEAAEQRGLVVLYPQQGRRDNVYRCWNWFVPSAGGPGETAELLELARVVRGERVPQTPRIIVVGFSAGGYMAVNLACAGPTFVAGVGVASGGPYHCAVGPEGAIRCMRGLRLDAGGAANACLGATGTRILSVRASLWHGGGDAVVSPANLTALETMFARVDGARTMRSETRDGAVWAVHRDGHGAPVVEAWLVPTMGHAWSGGDPRGTHTWPPGPDTTRYMLDFLLGDSVEGRR